MSAWVPDVPYFQLFKGAPEFACARPLKVGIVEKINVDSDTVSSRMQQCVGVDRDIHQFGSSGYRS
jgi:hypothetical protein